MVLFARMAWFACLLLCVTNSQALAQASASTAASSEATQPKTQSIGDALKKQNGQPIHILYLHGIGALGGNDSAVLRRHICEYLDKTEPDDGCTYVEPVYTAQHPKREYADMGQFSADVPPPAWTYLGKPIWQPKEYTQEQNKAAWLASRPYVDHWVLNRKHSPPVLVEEINWWPLVLLPKCRNIMAGEASLAGPSNLYLDICAGLMDKQLRKLVRTEKLDPSTYSFLSPASVSALKSLPIPSARLNRGLKEGILDWGLSDAAMAIGPMHELLVEAIQQLLVKTVRYSGEELPLGVMSTDVYRNKPQYIIVSHSLGSYLVFSALNQTKKDLPDRLTSEEAKRRASDFLYILYETSNVFFLANQVSLLELASLGNTDLRAKDSALFSNWIRAHYGGGNPNQPQIVAWSDPSDLLTWYVPPIDCVHVVNIPIKNAIHWFWLFEGPLSAHDNYAKKNKVIRAAISQNYAAPAQGPCTLPELAGNTP